MSNLSLEVEIQQCWACVSPLRLMNGVEPSWIVPLPGCHRLPCSLLCHTWPSLFRFPVSSLKFAFRMLDF